MTSLVCRIALLLIVVVPTVWAEAGPRHYAFFGFERDMIHGKRFLESTGFEGAQLRYSWKELEPAKDGYDFSAIERDLNTLEEAGKRLFLQIQDVSFEEKYNHTPNYLREDEAYNGGAELQFMLDGDDESTAKREGWVARRWDPAVQERLQLLLNALGHAFDGRVEGIALCETAIEFGTSGKLYPKGYTPERYRDAIIENMTALKAAFPRSVALQYANFMPGDWSEHDGPEYLRSVYEAGRALGVAMGGPDIKVNKYWQMQNSYPLIRESDGIVPTGIAVQWGNYEEIDPTTKKKVTVESIYAFARDYLRTDYLFWGIQPPFFRKEVMPFVD